MARVEISTAPFASFLAHPGKPILTGGGVLTEFAPIRAIFACARSNPLSVAIEREDEELLQCKRGKFATVACSRVRVKRRPPAALENSLPAQFITYQTRNSVQSNGATSHYEDLHEDSCLVDRVAAFYNLWFAKTSTASKLYPPVRFRPSFPNYSPPGW